MKQKNNSKSKIVLGIILAIIIILCAIYVDLSNNNNKFEEKPNNIYSNLNIDKSKLNIFYLNVGQADSTLITMGEDVMFICHKVQYPKAKYHLNGNNKQAIILEDRKYSLIFLC